MFTGTARASRRYAPMRTLLLTLPIAALAACYPGTAALHDVHVDIAKGHYAWCLSPDGRAVAWASTGRDGMGRTYGTCTPPNRFVHVHACGAGQVPADESPAALAARVRLSGNNSLIGDSFNGRPFCAPHPPS